MTSVMFELLANNGREFEEQTKYHINEYADSGLRTLILAYRELDDKEYDQFNRELTEAKNLVSADQEEIVEDILQKIEKDLILLGATAVEDKLQDGVCYLCILILLALLYYIVRTCANSSTCCMYRFLNVLTN